MLTLETIRAIEIRHGSLYQIAEDLLHHSLPAAVAEDILCLTGIVSEETPASEALAHLLLDVLEPVDTMGAVGLGEEYPTEDDTWTLPPSVGFSWAY